MTNRFLGTIRRYSGNRKEFYISNLLFISRQLAHIVLLSRGFGNVSPMFRFLLCVLYRPVEEVFTSPGQLALSTLDGFSHFSRSVHPTSPTPDTLLSQCFTNVYQINNKVLRKPIESHIYRRVNTNKAFMVKELLNYMYERDEKPCVQ